MNGKSRRKFIRHLLAASCLTAAAASATTFNETSLGSGDFPNAFASATSLPIGTDVVLGAYQGNLSQDIDFFKFVNLLAGASFTVSATSPSGFALLSVFNSGQTQIGTTQVYSSAAGTVSGTVPGNGMLVLQLANSEGGGPYTVTLTGPVSTPEPATVGLTALGLAAAAIAARRKLTS